MRVNPAGAMTPEPRPRAAGAARIAVDRRAVAAAVIVVATILLVHHRVYTIPFMYSEIAGIEHNPVVKDPALFVARMLTPRGLVERPLSVLSYMADHAIYGGAIAGYHVTNVVIHCVNALLVLALAWRFFAAPLVAALVFALHPLATACVSQIFGRNYSLATTFFLAAVYLYLRWRSGAAASAAADAGARSAEPAPLAGLSPARIAVLAALFVLTVLTKQSLAVLPLVLAWCELGRFAPRQRATPSGSAAADRGGGRRASVVVLVIAVASSLTIAVVLVALYAVPLSRTAPISPLEFLWSQLGNALTTAGFYLLPYRTALIHGLPVYRGPMHPQVVTGGLVVAALVVLAWRGRTRPSGWLLGAMLLCLLPANSVLPKNEIVREWRLYPSLAFFALLVGEVVDAVVAHARRRHRLLAAAAYAALALYLASFVHTDLRQNAIYQTGTSAWRQVLARYPRWADAMNNLGFYRYYAGDYAGARHYFAGAVRAAPDVYLYRQNLARAYAALGKRARARRHAARAAAVFRRYGGRTMALDYR